VEELPEDSTNQAGCGHSYHGQWQLKTYLERAEKYRKYLNYELYIISLKQRKYQKFERQ
jgi:hypothetical protein